MCRSPTPSPPTRRSTSISTASAARTRCWRSRTHRRPTAGTLGPIDQAAEHASASPRTPDFRGDTSFTFVGSSGGQTSRARDDRRSRSSPAGSRRRLSLSAGTLEPAHRRARDVHGDARATPTAARSPSYAWFVDGSRGAPAPRHPRCSAASRPRASTRCACAVTDDEGDATERTRRPSRRTRATSPRTCGCSTPSKAGTDVPRALYGLGVRHRRRDRRVQLGLRRRLAGADGRDARRGRRTRIATPGTRTVKVTVTDDDGATETAAGRRSTVTDANTAPAGRPLQLAQPGAARPAAVGCSRTPRTPRTTRSSPSTGTSTATAATRPTAATSLQTQPHVRDGRRRTRSACASRTPAAPIATRRPPRSASSTPAEGESSTARACSTSARPAPTRTPRPTTARSSRAPGTPTTTAPSTTAPARRVQVAAGQHDRLQDRPPARHRRRGRDGDRHAADHRPPGRPGRDLRPGRRRPLPGGGTVSIGTTTDPTSGADDDHDPERPGRPVPEPLHAARRRTCSSARRRARRSLNPVLVLTTPGGSVERFPMTDANGDGIWTAQARLRRGRHAAGRVHDPRRRRDGGGLRHPGRHDRADRPAGRGLRPRGLRGLPGRATRARARTRRAPPTAIEGATVHLQRLVARRVARRQRQRPGHRPERQPAGHGRQRPLQVGRLDGTYRVRVSAPGFRSKTLATRW